MLCGHYGIALQATANRGREAITKLFLENGVVGVLRDLSVGIFTS